MNFIKLRILSETTIIFKSVVIWLVLFKYVHSIDITGSLAVQVSNIVHYRPSLIRKIVSGLEGLKDRFGRKNNAQENLGNSNENADSSQNDMNNADNKNNLDSCDDANYDECLLPEDCSYDEYSYDTSYSNVDATDKTKNDDAIDANYMSNSIDKANICVNIGIIGSESNNRNTNNERVVVVFLETTDDPVVS